jgi:hypothetical protein
LGGNDYNAPLFGGKAMAEVRSYVPEIVDRIASGVEVRIICNRTQHVVVTAGRFERARTYALQTLIGLGAVDVVVPGVLPIGCFPLYLTLYPSSSKDDYDEIGCLTLRHVLTAGTGHFYYRGGWVGGAPTVGVLGP